MSAALLSVRDLRVDVAGVRVLEGISFDLHPGEMLAVVGRSGSGKSTLARALLRLVEPSGGKLHWRGRDLMSVPGRELRALRREMQIVFQDAACSLDPRWTVRAILGEPLAVHRLARRRDREAAVPRLLRSVELGPELLERYPHQLSSGQAQRVALARALATGPALLVADEALSAIDVSLRAQLANLLSDVCRAHGIACVFISHDLRLAAGLCDRIAVISDGALVECAPSDELVRAPRHPSARELVAAARALG